MFKYKVSVYMKSGNIIYLRLKDVKDLICQIFPNRDKSYTKDVYISFGINIDFNYVEALITKKWWQRWG